MRALAPAATHLRGCIIVWDVEPQPMADSCGHTLPQAEWVAAHKVCALTEWVIQSVEEVGRGWRQQVLQVLLQGIDVLCVRQR